MAKFKLRAEADVDVLELALLLGSTVKVAIEYIHQPTTACVASFQTDLTLSEIKELIDHVPDGHVMFDTITAAHEYTGIRK